MVDILQWWRGVRKKIHTVTRDATFDVYNVFDHNTQIFEISCPKRKNWPPSCSTSNVEKEDTVTSVSDDKSVVKPYLASVSEESVLAESDLTSDKSIFECTDYFSKYTSVSDASTTVATLALEYE